MWGVRGWIGRGFVRCYSGCERVMCGEVPHPNPPHSHGEGTCCSAGRGAFSVRRYLSPPHDYGEGWGGWLSVSAPLEFLWENSKKTPTGLQRSEPDTSGQIGTLQDKPGQIRTASDTKEKPRRIAPAGFCLWPDDRFITCVRRLLRSRRRRRHHCRRWGLRRPRRLLRPGQRRWLRRVSSQHSSGPDAWRRCRQCCRRQRLP